MKKLTTLAAFTALALSGGAFAQNYPTKPVRFISPYAPGGGTDILARPLAQKLNEAWNVPVIIDNRGGAGGTIGVDNVAKSVPDGYALIMTSTSLAIYPHVYPKLPFDLFRDFAPISVVSNTPELLTIHPSLPVKNVKELIALARARPGQLNGASTGNGGIAHLVIELFKMETGTNITHVPYGGAAPAVTATIGGHSQLLAADLPVLLPHVQSGKLRALFVTVRGRGDAETLTGEVSRAVRAFDGDLPAQRPRWRGVLDPRRPGSVPDDAGGRLHELPRRSTLVSDRKLGFKGGANGSEEGSQDEGIRHSRLRGAAVGSV